jgi:hypothetical protein
MKIQTYRLTLLALLFTASSQLFATGTEPPSERILTNFAGIESSLFLKTAPFETADFDEDGDMEAKFTTTGFKTIAKYRLTRETASTLLDDYPFLSIMVRSDRSMGTGKFLLILTMVQTDIGGEKLYEPVRDLTYAPWNATTAGLKLRLADIETKSFPDFAALLDRFAAGEGTYLDLGIVQQTEQGREATAYYDRITLNAK